MKIKASFDGPIYLTVYSRYKNYDDIETDSDESEMAAQIEVVNNNHESNSVTITVDQLIKMANIAMEAIE